MSKSPIKAIREKCLDCCGGNNHEVRFCGALDCPLWYFRFGGNPYHTKSNLFDRNPLLTKDLFVGLENKSATETNKIIKQRCK